MAAPPSFSEQEFKTHFGDITKSFRLSEGTFSTVYLARPSPADPPMAVKVPKPWRMQRELAQRISANNELLMATAAMNASPHVVKVLRSYRQQSGPIVMAFVPADVTVLTYLQTRGGLVRPTVAIDTVRQL